MKSFTNIFGTKIQHKPFFQSSSKTWRIARYENEKLDIVFESLGFSTELECSYYIECVK
jgi:hypothetical protein